MAQTVPARLEMRGIWKSFGGVPVLRDAYLTVGVGECVALLGQNGAGKSTLIKILCGDYQRDQGVVRLDGREVAFATPRDAVAHGVRMLPQEISVIPEMSIAENIFIGELPAIRRYGLSQLDRRRLLASARELLAELGLDRDPDMAVKDLSAPEQRVVEIARALAGHARVLVMDEPTAALTAQETETLFQVIRRLRARGVGIVYISHRLDEVFEISDRITVLRDGRNVGDFVTAQATRADVLRAMVGENVGRLYPERDAKADREVLTVERLSVRGHLTDLSFSVRRGEIVGVFGLIGSGIGVVGKALFGALPPAAVSGRILLGNQPFRPAGPAQAMAAGVGYVPAERKQEGIIPDMDVRANITLPFLRRFVRGVAIAAGVENRYALDRIERLRVATRGLHQKIRYLSGGNQQKVVLARWLTENLRLLVVEEPTRGVDVGARAEIYSLLDQLSAGGLAVLVISSDVEEVAGLCDRIIVLDRGRVTGEYTRGVAPQELMDVATGAVRVRG